MGERMYHIINNEKKLNSIAIGGWFTKGSFYDQVGKEGEHHFLEHIIFNTPFVKTYSNKFREKGLVPNAFTSHELMCFYIVCVEDFFSEAYEYIHDLLDIKLDLSKELGFDNERLIIKREIEYHYNYIEELKKLLLSQMFDKDCANFDIMGNMTSVDNINQSDMANIYNSLFSGHKFITIVGNKLPISKNMYDLMEINRNVFNDIIVSGHEKYINDADDCEYCYYGLSRFFEKVYRNAGLVYTEYLKEALFVKLREENGLTYRINKSNMNLYSGLIAFWIFKIRRRDLELVQDVVMSLLNQKLTFQDFARYEQILRVRTLIHSDNTTSEMLSLGYSNTILYGEEPDVYDFHAFYEYLEFGKEDVYHRIIGIRSQI